jgi:tryptophanyl-tRNA synthetase
MFNNAITKKLKEKGISFEVIENPPIKTVEDGVKFLRIEADNIVPTLILKADGKLLAVLKRGDQQLDLEAVKRYLKVKNLTIANKEEILEKLGAAKGAIPMVTGLPTLMDETVLEKEYIYGGIGDFRRTLKIRPADLKNITKAKVINMIKKHRVFSGLRPTNILHLGNYLGAIKGQIELQNKSDFDCIYSVVDLHGITTPFNPKTLQKQIRELVLDLLGAGLDPKKCHLMVQSQVPEHVELAYLLGTIYPVSRLEDLPTYKDKKIENPQYLNMGLLYYPVLMAADILVYKADTIPVGKDQLPHIEVAREIARTFNRMYSKTFPEPKAYLMPGAYVPSLKGEGKMSKSIEGSYILLTDDLQTIRKRLAGAPTDSGRGSVIPKEGGVANLLVLVELFEGKEARQEYERQYLNEGIRYDRLKDNLAIAIYKELEPIQERRKYYEDNFELVEGILEEGREYCSQIAQETLSEVKKKMGLI